MRRTRAHRYPLDKADLVVAIACYDESQAISLVTQQAASALATYFAGTSAAIIACDELSSTTTRTAFFSVDSTIPKIYCPLSNTSCGKRAIVRALFEKALDLDARAIVVVNGNLLSVTPEFIRDLAQPLLSGYECVIPMYVRDKNDGLITNHLAYPITRALYGTRIRQPLCGEFGFSGQLARYLLDSPLWEDAASSYGVDIWMTTLSITTGRSLCQTFVGGPRIYRGRDIGLRIAAMVTDIATTLFRLMKHFEDYWRAIRWSRPTPIFGLNKKDIEDPSPVMIDEAELYRRFVSVFDSYEPLYEKILDADLLSAVQAVRASPYAKFEFGELLWANIVYSYAAVSKAGAVPESDLMNSFIPLFAGRVASYARSTRGMDLRGVEEYFEHQCLVFEETKPYLLRKWFDQTP